MTNLALTLVLTAGMLVAVPVRPAVAAGQFNFHDDDLPGVVETEGDGGGTKTMSFTVTYSGGMVTDDVDVDWEVVRGTATVGDFGDGESLPSGTLEFFANTSGEMDAQVELAADDLPELDDTFRVVLSNPTGGATVGPKDEAIGVIVDDDPVTASVSGMPVVSETDADSTTADLTVTLDQPHEDVDVTVSWRTVDGTAAAGEDYEGVPFGALTIPEGDDTGTIPVTILDDAVAEGSVDEDLHVELTDVTDGAVDPTASRATATIEDDDGSASLLYVRDVEVVEGDGTAEFEVVLSEPAPSGGVSFTASTSDDSTQGSSDYGSVNETSTILQGETTKTIPVTIEDDNAAEPTETFSLNLESPNPSTVEIADGVGTGTIVDDDVDASLPTARVAVSEGETATFEVDLSPDAGPDGAEIDWVVVEGRGSLDDAAVTGGTLVYAEGEGTKTIEVPIVDDGIHEDAETLRVRLVAARGAAALGSPSEQHITIWDHDSAPFVRVRDTEVPEGSSGTTPAAFELELDEAAGTDVEVHWRTTERNEDDGRDATVDTDYTHVADGVTVIPAGQTTASLEVPVHGDTTREDNELFFVDLRSTLSTGARVPDPVDGGRATGTIIDDDGARFVVYDASVPEGEAHSGSTAEFVVELRGQAPFSSCDNLIRDCPSVDNPFVVEYRTRQGPDGAEHRASSTNGESPDDVDYVHTTGELTFAPGEFAPGEPRTKTVPVPFVGDGFWEASEWFTLEISLTNDPANDFATIQDGTAVGTIVNDDGPAMTISDVEVVEGDGGSTSAVFTVEIDGTRREGRTIRADWTTGTPGGTDGLATATPDVDYQAGSGTVELPPGVDQAVIEVPVVGDLVEEPDEVFAVHLSQPDYAEIVDGEGVATVLDDDGADGGSDGGGSDGGGSDGGTTDGGSDGGGSDGGGGGDTGEVFRSSGEHRIATAVAVSADHWGSADAVVLATAWEFPDALAGGALAAGLQGPLLLTDADELPPIVAGEIDRLGATEAWILGGPQAVGPEVERALEDGGVEVFRLAGADRFETAAEIVRSVQLPASGEVVLALGAHADDSRAWPDALSAGSLAASSDQLPTLLTAPDELPTATEEALADLGAQRVRVLGGPAAVGDAVVQQLEDLGYAVDRLSGSSRYGTSVAVAKDALQRQPDGELVLIFATGQNFPDGLSAGALAARFRGLVVLVPPDDLAHAPEVQAFLQEHADRFDQGVIVGGSAVVSEDVRAQLAQAMQAD